MLYILEADLYIQLSNYLLADIEYALHYLPVLAALLLSGHIKKGDTVDLPVPYPEVWKEVVAYVYTGRGAVTSLMMANILYLGGSA